MNRMKDSIQIKGARVNNLKDISLEIPRGKLVVITGLSGSGKSSLAFDTLYAEGQRRYVESLSSYARQFLGRMNKPECDYVKGIPPAIAIEQKVTSRNPRSTVGTSTEIYEYLRLLFARIGRTFSPVSGKEVKRHTTEDAVQCMLSQPEGSKLMVMCPIRLPEGRTLEEQLDIRVYGTIRHFRELFEVIMKESLNRHFTIIFDEFQTLYKVNPAIFIAILLICSSTDCTERPRHHRAPCRFLRDCLLRRSWRGDSPVPFQRRTPRLQHSLRS